MNIKLSVVIPAFNESKRISQTLEGTDAYLRKQNYDYEIIVVDNGSNDNTCDIVKEYQERSVKNLVRLCLSKSIGAKGSAVKMGILDYAHGDFVVFMDADNATPISEIEKFWPFLESAQYQVVIGSRYVHESNVSQKQPFYRVVLSRMSNLLIQILLIKGIKDTQLGFKAFLGKAAKDIFSQVSVPGWGFDMEVLTIAIRHGYKIREVGVIWRERGGSHVPLGAYVQSFLDLLKIKINSILGRYNKK
ncbi:MAG: dolichyl-phosphate beta-glucosyltransferase [Candidatus Doudnabacteria bacterium]|nr:glycosyltransferase family 2 protein [bacterium]MDZ4243652.1 dolichyl-phosphate beta-glucosyltransferase [Candidatus Doudnabacteria bacterium]